MNKPCGPEMILDIHNCDINTMSRESLENFFVELCKVIDMERTELHIWEYLEDENKDPEEFQHLKGLSAVQFIKTSSIVVHTFDNLNKVSINLFSCKNFNPEEAQRFCVDYFKGECIQATNITRY